MNLVIAIVLGVVAATYLIYLACQCRAEDFEPRDGDDIEPY